MNYSANNSQTQINVKGWKIHTNNSDFTFSYNHELCELQVHIASTTIPDTPSTFTGFVIPEGYKPSNLVASPIFASFSGHRAIVQVNKSGAISRYSYTGATMTNKELYATLQWKY